MKGRESGNKKKVIERGNGERRRVRRSMAEKGERETAQEAKRKGRQNQNNNKTQTKQRE